MNLRGWTLGALNGIEYTIAEDVWLLAKAYTVIVRKIDPATNGGVSASPE